MIEKIVINSDNPYYHRFNLKKGRELSLEFKEGVNVLIGENGSGKSSVFAILKDLVFKDPKMKGVALKVKDAGEKEDVFLFNKDDFCPRTQMSKITPFDKEFAHKTSFWFNRGELSSGQNTLEFIDDVKVMAKRARLFVFDEPEVALDAKNILKFKKILKGIGKDCQVILITHHPALILDDSFNVVEMKGGNYLSDVRKLYKEMKC